VIGLLLQSTHFRHAEAIKKKAPEIHQENQGLLVLHLVGRGNLNRQFILLKIKEKFRFNIRVEYHLEYRVTGFELRMRWCSL